MADPGPPKWLGLEGFARCTEGGAAEDVKASPQDLAPEGFVLFSRFCRGLSVVPLGLNVDADGDTSEGKDGKNAAMYFVIAVRVPEEEAAKEVDVGRVAMHRSMGKFVRNYFCLHICSGYKCCLQAFQDFFFLILDETLAMHSGMCSNDDVSVCVWFVTFSTVSLAIARVLLEKSLLHRVSTRLHISRERAIRKKDESV